MKKYLFLLAIVLGLSSCGGKGPATMEAPKNVAVGEKTAAITPQSGWWWNSSEGGRGYTIEAQNGNVFMAAYMYDASGRATWYAAGPAPMNGSTFSSRLMTYMNGQTLTGTYRTPTANDTNGDVSITFSDSNRGVITWPDGRTTSIERYNIVTDGASIAATAGSPQTGWWWNSAEGGSGYSIEIQNGTMFLAGYMYDSDGNPIWYASGPTAMSSSTSYTGTLQQYGNGQTLTGSFKAASVVNSSVTNVTLTFTSASTATLSFSNGRTIPLTRYTFGTAPGSTAPTNVTVTNVDAQTVKSTTFYSSSKLKASWTAPTGITVNSYKITASQISGTGYVTTTALASDTNATITGLKAGTAYSIVVVACKDAGCTQYTQSAAATGTTSEEYWQLQGTGSTTAGLTRIVSDANVRISATKFGSDSASQTANRVQLYYGPMGSQRQALSTALSTSTINASVSSSYLSFTSSNITTGLLSPSTATTAIQTVATGQGVPLSSAMGSKVRLFFEANGSDNKTRIYWIDSQDGYVGQDFNSGSSILCSTAADYSGGGGCVPTLAIAVQGDTNGNNKIINARQNKVGFPTLTDWRWNGAAGTFMVFTTDQVSGCSTYNMNHGYAVWDGSAWTVQYASDGCPKLFKSAQAAFPLHIGGVRYKMYYGDPSLTTGKITNSSLPFLGPKKLIYADGALSGQTDRVDYEDWESQQAARRVNFMWPSGDVLDSTAAGYIDDYHFLTPTDSLNLQVMYLAITNGTETPFGSSAILLNP